MITVISIAVGGALGALLRYFLGNQISIIFGTNFPWGILLINIFGSFLLAIYNEKEEKLESLCK